jgi:hypothetical protein
MSLQSPGSLPANTPARPLEAWIDSVALIGPGLADWAAACEVLRGAQAWQPAATVATLPPILPPAERRRTSLAVRIALAAGHQAIARSTFAAQQLDSVFASSGGDGMTCHLICEALAQQDRRISPTHFHNSVHNAPSGYWGIAMGATPSSTSLCGYDASFATGLLEAMAQVAANARPVILIAYDAPYPEPLRRCRPVADAFGLALVLAPHATANAAMRMTATLGCAEPTPMGHPALEAMRLAIPTARALPLMQALARQQAATVAIEYLASPLAADPPSRLCLALSAAAAAGPGAAAGLAPSARGRVE